MARKPVALTIILGIVALAAAAPASATFPGRNGRVAYPTSSGISTAKPNGTDAHQLIAFPGARDPAWSADGKRLAFVVPGRKGHLLVYVVRAGGTHPRRVSRTGVDRWQPSWSPDGKELAVLGTAPPVNGLNRAHVLVLEVADGHEREVADTAAGGNFGDAEWSPDGGVIAFTNELDIFLVSPSGGTPVQVTHQPTESESSPSRPVRELSWAPGGRRLAFSEEWACPCDDDMNLAVIRRDGSGRHDFDSGDTERHPAWSPDAKAIDFCHYEPFVTPFAVWTMRPDGGGQHEVVGDVECGVAWQALPRSGRH
jgi:Tol biopolymer transport system component